MDAAEQTVQEKDIEILKFVYIIIDNLTQNLQVRKIKCQ